MKSILKHFKIQTQRETELINITAQVQEFVEASGVNNGIALIMSLHTTSAITVNEGLPDLESDIASHLERLIPNDIPYRHARFLHSDGQMAINAPSHIKSAILGFEVLFPIDNGKIVLGSRQTIYFVELDGPQYRGFVVQILGD
jgi:secondary thiamine-phosphate synthase enzyme